MTSAPLLTCSLLFAWALGACSSTDEDRARGPGGTVIASDAIAFRHADRGPGSTSDVGDYAFDAGLDPDLPDPPSCPDCKSTTITYTVQPPSIDGKLGEFASAPPIQLKTPGASATLRLMWDYDALYAAIDVRDHTLNATEAKRDGRPFDDDAIELAFDTVSNGGATDLPSADDFKFVVNIKGTQYDARGAADWESRRRWDMQWQASVTTKGSLNNADDRDTGYTIELRLPWIEWENQAAGFYGPEAADIWRIDARLNDNAGSTTHSIAWSNRDGRSFNNPDGFGLATFSPPL